MNSRFLLAFDPGNTTGYAVLKENVLVDSGIIKFKPEHPHTYLKKVRELYETYLPIGVFVEAPFIGFHPKAGLSLSEKVGMIKGVIFLYFPEALIELISNTDVKHTICGRVKGIKKPDMIKRINKMVRKEVKNDNEADAIAIAYTAFRKYMPEKDIELLTPEEAQEIKNRVLTPCDFERMEEFLL